jgi:glycosyltransferase involved in cell wall biosynthesis
MNYSHSEFVTEQAAEKFDANSRQIALPRVSVIVTSFNYARYVSQALDSVASQTYQNFDCVIVDDASTDESNLLIERWIEENKDPRFCFIRNSSNRGQTASFAVGLAATSSEFVAFLDADDFWFPQFLQRHVEAHLNRSFSVSLSCSDLIQVDDERRMLSGTLAGPVFEERDALTYSNVDAANSVRIAPGSAGLEFLENPETRYIHPNYASHPWTATSGMMFRRAVLDIVMPKDPDQLRICTDWFVFVICHYLTGSLAIRSALGAYRRHGSNNFASNPVMGSDVPCAPSAITRHHTTVVSLMIHHLLDHRDRFEAVFPYANMRRFVRILYTMALQENVSIRNPNLRSELGARGIFEANVRARLSFLRPIISTLRPKRR